MTLKKTTFKIRVVFKLKDNLRKLKDVNRKCVNYPYNLYKIIVK